MKNGKTALVVVKKFSRYVYSKSAVALPNIYTIYRERGGVQILVTSTTTGAGERDIERKRGDI